MSQRKKKMCRLFNIHPFCVNTWVEGVEPSIQGEGHCDQSVNRCKREDSNSLFLLSKLLSFVLLWFDSSYRVVFFLSYSWWDLQGHFLFHTSIHLFLPHSKLIYITLKKQKQNNNPKKRSSRFFHWKLSKSFFNYIFFTMSYIFTTKTGKTYWLIVWNCCFKLCCAK